MNINYLKYFYHLFPIHVKKFYSMFHSLINPHIYEIKCLVSCLSRFSPLIVFKGLPLVRITNASLTCSLKPFVCEHVRELQSVICQVKEKLSRDLWHIIDVLDNSTKEITKKVPGIIDGVYKDFRGNVDRIKIRLDYLAIRLDQILRSSIDSIRERIESACNANQENMSVYLSYIKKLPKLSPMINNLKITSREIRNSYFIKHGEEFEDEHRPYLNSYREALISLWAGKGYFRNVRPYVDRIQSDLERAQKISRLMSNLIEGLSSYQGYKRILYTNLERNKSELSRIGGLVNSLGGANYIGRFDPVIKGINKMKMDYGKIDRFLVDNLKDFIHGIGRIEQDSNYIRDRIKIMQSSVSRAISDISSVLGAIQFLDRFKALIRRLRLTEPIRPDIAAIGEIINDIRKIGRDLKIVEINIESGMIERMEEISVMDGCHCSYSELEDCCKCILSEVPELGLSIESYINKLRAVQVILPYLNAVEDRKNKLRYEIERPLQMTVLGVGMEGLEEIKAALNNSRSIIQAIDHLEQAYHFEATSLEDIGVGVKYLKDIVINTRKVRSDIESYIKFLEGIGKSSEVLENIKIEVENLPPLETISRNLNAYVPSLKDKLSSIETGIDTIKKISCRIRNVENMKSNIKKIRELVFNIQGWLASVQDITNRIHTENAKISHQLKIISTLVHISSNIESSSLSLSNTGISYSKPESDSQKKLIECLFRSGRFSESIGSNTVKTIYGKIRSIEKEIDNLEQKIDSFMNCFLECSIKSIILNTIESTKRLLTSGDQLNNNELPRQFLRCLENMGCQYNIWSDTGNG